MWPSEFMQLLTHIYNWEDTKKLCDEREYSTMWSVQKNWELTVIINCSEKYFHGGSRWLETTVNYGIVRILMEVRREPLWKLDCHREPLW